MACITLSQLLLGNDTENKRRVGEQYTLHNRMPYHETRRLGYIINDRH